MNKLRMRSDSVAGGQVGVLVALVKPRVEVARVTGRGLGARLHTVLQ